MNLAKKGALLSGLALPGLGQWVMGARGKGALTMAVFMALLVGLFVRVFQIVHDWIFDLSVLDRPGVSTLAEIHRDVYFGTWYLILPLLAIWIWSVVDAIQEGKRRGEVSTDSTSPSKRKI